MYTECKRHQLLPVLTWRRAHVGGRARVLHVPVCELLLVEPAGMLRGLDPEHGLLRSEPARLLRNQDLPLRPAG
jgi:hypothetical protein